MTVAPERTALSVRPVAGHIGAEISGVDLSAPLDETTVAGLTAALHRHKVIFFRGQELDHAAQIRFGRHFGELTYAHPHDDAPPEGHPEIFTVDPERYATAASTRSAPGGSTATWPAGTPTSPPR
jgi:taurine dioxygenase